jgi:hypothetical protein
MITIPSLNDVTDILDTDMIMVTQASGQSYKIAGSELNKRGKIIIANSTTITGAPLKAGSSVRVYFTVDLTAANASTTLQLNYNGVNYYVKAPKDGTLINFVATNLGGSPAVYKYLQKYTTLELLFDGTQFVIIGNPVILSSADYTIYADGLKRIDSVSSGDMSMITSNAVAFFRGRTIYETGQLNIFDNQTKTVTLEGNRQYLYMNIHAVYGGEIQLLACYNGNLYRTKVCSGRGQDTTFTNNGQELTIKANGSCRGHLFKVTEFSAT